MQAKGYTHPEEDVPDAGRCGGQERGFQAIGCIVHVLPDR
jgi:hypothetical protein